MDRTLGDNYTTVGGKRQFTNGPPGTTIDAAHMNAVQEEIMTVIANAGLTPSSTDLTQLYQAIVGISNNPLLAKMQTWTEQTNPKNFDLSSVVWNGSIFCAVGGADGGDAYIITSPDGVVWTEQTNPKNFYLSSVVWNGSIFCAVGVADGGDAYIITSPDGIVWTEQANPKNFDLRTVVWSAPLGLFCAGGATDGVDSYIITSPDGIVWSEIATAKTNTILGGTWANGIFILVGAPDGTDAYVITSPDGTNWTEQKTAAINNIWGIEHNGNSYFGASTNISGYFVGKDVTSMSTRPLPSGYTIIYNFAWGNSILIAVGNGANIAYSADGIVWSVVTKPKNFSLYDGAWNGERFVLVGAADGTDALIVTSAAI